MSSTQNEPGERPLPAFEREPEPEREPAYQREPAYAPEPAYPPEPAYARESSYAPSPPTRTPLTRQQARRRRQSFTFLGLIGFTLVMGLIAGGSWQGWWTIAGRREPAAVYCPVQVVTDPDLTSVNVYNGTPRSGLGAAVAKEMQKRGFHVATIQSLREGKRVTSIARITYGPAGDLAAHTVALQFPAGVKLVQDDRADDTVDILIGDKYKAMVSRKQGAAAIKLKVAPANCVDPPPSPDPAQSAPAPAA